MKRKLGACDIPPNREPQLHLLSLVLVKYPLPRATAWIQPDDGPLGNRHGTLPAARQPPPQLRSFRAPNSESIPFMGFWLFRTEER